GYVGDGRWYLASGGVRTAPNGIGYDRFLLVGDRRWPTDYDVVVPMTTHAGDGWSGVGIAVGWAGHIPGLAAASPVQPMLENRYQTIAWVRSFPFPANPVLQLKDDEIVRDEISVPMALGTAYMLRVRTETVAPGVSHVGVKYWPQGSPEPAEWMLSDDFASRDGSIALIAHNADVTFGNVSINALPSFPLHDLTTTVDGGGAIVRFPDYAAYSDSAKVTLTAVPDDGWLFNNWSGAVTGSTNPATVVMDADKSVTAFFKRKQFKVTLMTSGNGTLTADPDTTKFLYGDTLILTAAPDAGYYFYGWYGDHTGNANPDTILVEGDMIITALFFSEITGIGPTPEIEVLTVLQNSPNPFRLDTYLNIGLPRADEVEFTVFDVAGRRVYSQRLAGAAGWNRFLFAGRDDSGHALPSGVYFYQVRTPGAAVTNKMVILR
ncbi:MAG: putative Fibronectin type protein, partial [Candidatus Krumholzibacteriota bacterium]|nr:putative Fibronectin type protein [Candidatus Krumholzibacteriota bacterium]